MFQMPEYEVTSEIYSECDYRTAKTPTIHGNVVSEFPFEYPRIENGGALCDEDGDLIVERKKHGFIQIEHSISTVLPLVGLQVWRGALLLADLALHWGHAGKLSDTTLLEVGAGTGLSSFVTAMYAKRVICTDVNIGGILDLIKVNVKRNENMFKSNVVVTELDFTKEFSDSIKRELSSVNLVFAADVIYDDRLTESFMKILEELLNTPPTKSIIIALEKRYVFTVADLESVAPCYETFLSLLEKCNCRNLKHQWTIEQIPVDFPQYFKYDRVKELVLWKITSGTF
ncbi:methyltransferase-like protein 22 isoform X4 [Arctopsyche grandis]|uniref:methyltransferase-like protein 22 isoform X4 n=1 Tax=Arctopsyche grandis TaxID=121162 RepID=UPI00406D8264